MYLYWGGRDARSDFLYQPELGRYLEDHRLSGLNTAFSRTDERAYVQDKLKQDELAVRQVIEDIIKPLHIDIETLRGQGRYLEDVY